MPGTITPYNHFSKLLADGSIDWVNDTVNLMLLTASHTIDLANTVKADLTNELAAGNGYTAGGIALTGKTLTQVSGIQWKADADDVTFPFTGSVTFRYGVLYIVGTVNGLIDPLLAYILFDSTPADITTSTNYLVPWHPDGIFTIG